MTDVAALAADTGHEGARVVDEATVDGEKLLGDQHADGTGIGNRVARFSQPGGEAIKREAGAREHGHQRTLSRTRRTQQRQRLAHHARAADGGEELARRAHAGDLRLVGRYIDGRRRGDDSGAGGLKIALYAVDGEYYATADLCTHGAAKLSDGWVEDGCVECPLHQGTFDIRTGAPCKAPVTEAVRTFPVRVVAGRVEVGV